MRFICSYGPTEGSITSTIYAIDSQEVHTAPPWLIPLGHPLPNTSLYVLDEDQNLCTSRRDRWYPSGTGLAVGYLKRAELTRERFIELSKAEYGISSLTTYASRPAGRLYRTWDPGAMAGRWQCGVCWAQRQPGERRVCFSCGIWGEIEALIKSDPAVNEVLALAIDFAAGVAAHK